MKRLSSGKRGLLWQGDETGVAKDKLLNTSDMNPNKLSGLLGG